MDYTKEFADADKPYVARIMYVGFVHRILDSDQLDAEKVDEIRQMDAAYRQVHMRDIP